MSAKPTIEDFYDLALYAAQDVARGEGEEIDEQTFRDMFLTALQDYAETARLVES